MRRPPPPSAHPAHHAPARRPTPGTHTTGSGGCPHNNSCSAPAAQACACLASPPLAPTPPAETGSAPPPPSLCTFRLTPSAARSLQICFRSRVSNFVLTGDSRETPHLLSSEREIFYSKQLRKWAMARFKPFKPQAPPSRWRGPPFYKPTVGVPYALSEILTRPSHRALAKEISCRARSHTPPESTPPHPRRPRKLTGRFEEKQMGEIKAGEGGTAAAARRPPHPHASGSCVPPPGVSVPPASAPADAPVIRP